jgi:hypothetical protein
MWETNGQQVEVALYVRAVIVAENRKATASDRALALRHMAELGLTQGGLARNRWIIDGERPAEQVTRPDDTDRASPKSRFRSIEGGAA